MVRLSRVLRPLRKDKTIHEPHTWPQGLWVQGVPEMLVSIFIVLWW